MVIDFGIKNSQLRALLKHNVQLTIVDTYYKFVDEVFKNKYAYIVSHLEYSSLLFACFVQKSKGLQIEIQGLFFS